MFRKILGVVVAYLAWSFLWLGGTNAIRSAMPGAFDEQGATRSAGILLTFLALSVVLSVGSGWVAARLGDDTKAPAFWTGTLLLVTGLFFQISYWEYMPIWYHLPFLALLLPATMLGGSMHSARRSVATA